MPPERLGAAGRAQVSCPNCKATVLVRATGGENLECRLGQAHDSAPVIHAALVRPASGGFGASPIAVPAQAPGAAPAQAYGAAPAQAYGAAPARAPGAAPAQAYGAAPAPLPSDVAWFVAIGRDRQGPMTRAQLAGLLRAGTVNPESLVWCKGMTNWTKMVDAPQLASLVASASVGAAAAPVPAPEPAAPRPAAAVAAPRLAAQPAPLAAAGPAAPQPSAAPRPSSPLQPAARVGAAAQPVARPAPAALAPKPVSAARPADSKAASAAQPADYEDAGPTLEQPLPLFGKAAPSSKLVREPRPAGGDRLGAGKPAAPELNSMQADAHAGAFFSHDLDNVEFQLPDPNRHKPTKEEYQNLLQEFSVMFRLDKRTKRQKVGIAVTMGVLVVGVIVFGVMLKIDGDRKRSLMSDTKAILGMFALQYQTSVTMDVGTEDPEAAAQIVAVPGAPPPVKPKQQVQTSQLAKHLAGKIQARRKASARTVSMGLSAADQRALDVATRAAQADAVARALGGVGGKVESVQMVGIAKEKVSTAELNRMCDNASGDLRSCAKGVLGDENASFRVSFTVGLGGKIEAVKAIEDGKQNGELTTCAQAKLGRKSFTAQPEPVTHSCRVN